MMCGGLLGLLIIGLIIYLIIERPKDGHVYRTGTFVKNDALEILQERYVRGEISDEEYAKKKSILKN